ncbi:hypothetical protein LCI18_004217 [Fusarium solani-melongenae]|uniref:Uncharacterized protein n=1 Tax=Fusarium solani subsp. cucurbitae TaxID=2747967 RepID=A0ACD3YWC7_FUSSC|nr:hypothetical protein LCI18_004217 [Fusarium solani-melongenae]
MPDLEIHQVHEEGGAQNDASIINHDVTEDCICYLLPSPLPQAFDLPTDFFFDTKKYQDAYAKDIKLLKFRNNIISNLVIGAEARQAAFTSTADVHATSGESYRAELVWFLYFNDDGSKVKEVVEFCDKDVILKMANTAA